MLGSTALSAALACRLNAGCRDIPFPRFFADNSTCRFCESVEFVRPRRMLGIRRGWKVLAATPDDWLDLMAAVGYDRALLLYEAPEPGEPPVPARIASAFVGGGGDWVVALVHGASMDCWDPAWDLGDREAPDKRIWRVHYGLVGEGMALPPDPAPVDDVAGELRAFLPEIEALARRQGWPTWGDCFAQARRHLDEEKPAAPRYHHDIAPDGLLPNPAARLLACCAQAWVFGGMGSWNDVAPDEADREAYGQLSDRLFDLVARGICAAVNAGADAGL
jgi:hypothetical protein